MNSDSGISNEAQMQDNRMSLDPNDSRWSSTLAQWQDGGEYEVRAKIQQVSPGEFTVTEVAPAEGSETPQADQTEQEPAEVSESDGGGYSNPAVERLANI